MTFAPHVSRIGFNEPAIDCVILVGIELEATRNEATIEALKMQETFTNKPYTHWREAIRKQKMIQEEHAVKLEHPDVKLFLDASEEFEMHLSSLSSTMGADAQDMVVLFHQMRLSFCRYVRDGETSCKNADVCKSDQKTKTIGHVYYKDGKYLQVNTFAIGRPAHIDWVDDIAEATVSPQIQASYMPLIFGADKIRVSVTTIVKALDPVPEPSTVEALFPPEEVKVCKYADDPFKLYFREVRQEWFYGPYSTLAQVAEAMRALDEYARGWDARGIQIIHGASEGKSQDPRRPGIAVSANEANVIANLRGRSV